MKNNKLTEIVFILDRSGSMAGLEADTIGGFNSMLKKQRAEQGRALISAVLFNSESTVLYDRRDISEIRDMTEQDYFPSGCTALLDAVGGAVRHIKNVHKYARSEDVPEKTLFIITTDGMENASHEFTPERIREMISAQKEKGWEFIFLGANIDAVETAASMGIDRDRAVDYNCDEKGTRLNYEVMSRAISSVRCSAGLEEGWAKEIKQDYKSRRKRRK